MGIPTDTLGRPVGVWRAARPYKARKFRQLVYLMVLLGIVMFFLVTDLVLRLMGEYRYSDLSLDMCCYSVLVGIAVLLGLVTIRFWRHFLALSIANDPVYRTFSVAHPREMLDVVEAGLKGLFLDHDRFDPPGRAYTNRERFPRNLQGMIRVNDPDLAIVVYTSSIKGTGRYLSDVLVGPVNAGNASQVANILRAIDDRTLHGRPVLNIRSEGPGPDDEVQYGAI